MSASPPSRAGYFSEQYRDYGRQNPIAKLDHYVDQVIGVSPGNARHLLDIGCGLGSFLERIAARRPDLALTATDTRPDAVASTRARVPGASVLLASAEALPLPDQSEDIVTAWDVVEHVSDLDRVKSEVMRVLRPRGLFCFVVPVYDGMTGPIVSRLDKDPTHIHKVARRYWVEWAEDGFQVLDWHGVFRYLLGRRYIHRPTKILRGSSPAIMLRCVKPS